MNTQTRRAGFLVLVTLVMASVISPAGPAAAQVAGGAEFTDATDARGLDGVDGGRVALGDVDADGFVDVVLVQGDGDVVLLFGGDQGFTRRLLDPPADVLLPRNGVPRLADFDSDGDPDLVIVDPFGIDSIVLENEEGAFDRVIRRLASDQAAGHGYVIDVDRDGGFDLFTGGRAGEGAGILVQRLSRFSSARIEGFAPEEDQRHLVVYRDVSNGSTRLLTGGSRFPAHEFQLDDLGPLYGAVSRSSLTNVVDTVAADFDGDQIDDILVLRSDTGATVTPEGDGSVVQIEMAVAGGSQTVLLSGADRLRVTVEPIGGLGAVDVIVPDGVDIGAGGSFAIDRGAGLMPEAAGDALRVGLDEDGNFALVLDAAVPVGARVRVAADAPVVVGGDLRNGDEGADWDALLEWDGSRWTATRPFETTTRCSSAAPGDFDNDGALDIVAVCSNGSSVITRLFTNLGDGEFVEHEMPAAFGADLSVDVAPAVADFDNDGRLDVLLAGPEAPLRLLRNTSVGGGWLTVVLDGTDSGDAPTQGGLGAVVTLTLEDGSSQRRDVRGGQQWGAQHEQRVHFGVGTATEIERAVVIWPSGRRQVLDAVGVDQVLSLTEPATDDPFAEVALDSLRFDPVVDPGQVSEIRVDAINVGTSTALNTVVAFTLPSDWEPLGLPSEVEVDGNQVRWPVADLGPGEIARLSLAVRAGEPGDGSLRITASGPFPTQQLHRPLLTTEGDAGVSPFVIAFLIVGAAATVIIAVVLTVRRARVRDDDDTWYESAIDLTSSPTAIFDPRPLESDSPGGGAADDDVWNDAPTADEAPLHDSADEDGDPHEDGDAEVDITESSSTRDA